MLLSEVARVTLSRWAWVAGMGAAGHGGQLAGGVGRILFIYNVSLDALFHRFSTNIEKNIKRTLEPR